MNVLAVPGSLRRNSYNRRLLEAAADRSTPSRRACRTVDVPNPKGDPPC